MTQNQSNQIVKNPNTKKAMAIIAKFAQVESEYKTLKKVAEDATDLIKQAMIEADVPKIDIDMPGLTGYITLAERTSYKAEDIMEVHPKYKQSVLDTEKVKAEAVLTGQLPAGVEESKTQYITKKFKVAE